MKVMIPTLNLSSTTFLKWKRRQTPFQNEALSI